MSIAEDRWKSMHDELVRMAREEPGPDAPDAAPEAAPDAAPETPTVPARKPVDLSQPLGYQPKPAAGDPEMDALKAKAKDARGMERVGQSVADFVGRPSNLLDYAQRLGGGGATPSPRVPNLMSGQADDAALAVGELKEKRSAAASAAALAEKKDPQSQTAKTYRSVLLKFAPDLAGKLENATPEQMEKIWPLLSKHSADNAAALKVNAEAKAKAELEAKKGTQRTEDQKIASDRFDRTDARSRESSAATLALAGANLGIRKDEVATKAAKDVEDDVQKLGKELPGDVADFEAKYQQIKAATAKTPGDVPGVGAWDARKPAALSSRADLDVQKNAGQMLAAYQKLITGAGASDAERENLAKISLDLTNEKSFAAGLESLKSAYDAKVRDVKARFRPEVVQKLAEGQKREAGGSTVKVRFPNGNIADVPVSEVEEAKSMGGVPQ